VAVAGGDVDKRHHDADDVALYFATVAHIGDFDLCPLPSQRRKRKSITVGVLPTISLERCDGLKSPEMFLPAIVAATLDTICVFKQCQRQK